MIEDVTRIVCGLVRVVMGMGANTVRPADQIMPSGGQVAQFATVKIISAHDSGRAIRSLVATSPSVTTENTDAVKIVVASVQFFRAPNADAAGIVRYSRAAFDRAARLRQRLQMSASVALMRSLGLGLLGAGEARDLTALADDTYESRGQIDLTFNVVNRESAVVQTILSAPVTLSLQPGPTRAFEVTS